MAAGGAVRARADALPVREFGVWRAAEARSEALWWWAGAALVAWGLSAAEAGLRDGAGIGWRLGVSAVRRWGLRVWEQGLGAGGPFGWTAGMFLLREDDS